MSNLLTLFIYQFYGKERFMERKNISEINFQSMQQAHLGNNPQFPVICTRVRAITFKVVEYERKEEHRYVLIIFSWQCIF